MKATRWLLTLAIVATACTSDAASESASGSAPPGAPAPTTLRVGTLNIEYGGEVIDFDTVVEGALELDADVIGIEEAWGNIPRLAEAMGWPYYDPRTQLVSRFPILDPPDADGTFTYVEVDPGRVVAIANVHLPSSPYGPVLARNGRSRQHILDVERSVRVPAIEPIATTVSALASDGVPAFVVGDFNAPSHRDWTSETIGTRPQMRFAVAWPVSLLMEELGFVDSFRAIHPDPVTEPGLTWPAGRPTIDDGWNPSPQAPADRIDFVWAAGPVETLDSVRLGEEGSAELSVSPYPTDHRGVVSTFRVEPGVPPVLVAPLQRRVEAGQDVQIAFHAPASGSGRVQVVDASGAEVATAPTDGAVDGTANFDGSAWPPGSYETVLLDAAGDELARAPVWIVDPDAGATLSVTEPRVSEGDPIGVSWTGSPGNRWDWLGIYRRDADPNVASYLLWDYTGATIEGSASFGPASEGPWPLPPGRYTVYLLEDDGYDVLGAVDLTIT
jgi:hypothetical protein